MGEKEIDSVLKKLDKDMNVKNVDDDDDNEKKENNKIGESLESDDLINFNFMQKDESKKNSNFLNSENKQKIIINEDNLTNKKLLKNKFTPKKKENDENILENED